MANMASMARMACMVMLAFTTLEADPLVFRGENCSRCKKFETLPDPNYEFLVLVSFSLPDQAWLSLSSEIEGRNGALVLRGIPRNSFQEFASRIAGLKKRGMTAPVLVNPLVFEQNQVTAVPSFLFFEENDVKKVSGNIPLRSAEEIIGGSV